MQIRLDLALVHYPVYNKNGETIGSAVTNLDLHDIARAGRTYGVGTLYIVTPYQDQQELVSEITAHWRTGHGAQYNSKRKDALSIVRLCSDLDELFALTTEKKERPIILATSAKEHVITWSYDLTRKKLYSGERFLILFGTAWGLTLEALNAVDGVLPPIKGQEEYNHLSVRSAAAIVLDRLLGNRT
ncbi:MAG: RNA methyltransferase [Thermodesulfobacteriota bacterium]|nr:RNA methyltransferase [Thermodesulfobacteriota bacterium]